MLHGLHTEIIYAASTFLLLLQVAPRLCIIINLVFVSNDSFDFTSDPAHNHIQVGYLRVVWWFTQKAQMSLSASLTCFSKMKRAAPFSHEPAPPIYKPSPQCVWFEKKSIFQTSCASPFPSHYSVQFLAFASSSEQFHFTSPLFHIRPLPPKSKYIYTYINK